MIGVANTALIWYTMVSVMHIVLMTSLLCLFSIWWSSCETYTWVRVDHLHVSFIRLPIPNEHFLFIESASYNAEFNPTALFLPVHTRNDMTNGIWKIDVSNPYAPVITFILALSQRDGQFFGSKLSKHGMMFVCAHNTARVLVIDIPNKRLAYTVQLPQPPNDITLINEDVTGQLSFLVCCNSNTFGMDHTLNALEVVAMDSGVVYKTDIHTDSGVVIVRRVVFGVKAVVGIILLGNILWISEATTLIRVNDYKFSNTTWERGHGGFDPNYLADNLTPYSEHVLLFPLFSHVNTYVRLCAQSKILSWIALRVLSTVSTLFHVDMEPPVSDSIRFILFDTHSAKSVGYKTAILPPRGYPDTFDSRVTHMERIGTTLFLVSYACKQVMMIHDFDFRIN